ncbi:isovaleryl-CoA dehydrogenase [Aneurinibacillus migulanus]|uniref:acyl-CoA dehydrogenase family protein n=1 Tax=Aneurinibacillus migulanus TaxID=47500 RepID=UPI0005B8C8D5|nr:acyl-CoA dehydrogenase family protein [Aneurinibacillus migulanus]KIV59310.1 isovaleryl-CoA dehydrogenase [Aneurinibacillus migulanus]KPD08295.1 isovaleryl-CoA dehydrogenase [Aneurinibacillus migulanus]MCP1356171.1 acyl-CoA dehydrogenase family protein [Aneurinibacillus migulanus]
MNLFREDPNLAFILKQYLDGELYAWAEQELNEFGERCGTDIDRRAAHTDREGQPRLIKYDKFGDDISEVWVNEGYRQTIAETYNRGIVGYVHKEIPELGRKGGYMYSYAQGYLLSQAEPGFYCPVTLTMATAYLLDQYAEEGVKQKFLPHVVSTGETELFEGATFLTERQGGSDVGANEVKALLNGERYKLYGEKYFASNAGMCGVAMVLARREGAPEGTKGLSLFAVPWRKEDGSVNGLQLRRLKDKLGVRAVPSGEVVFEGADAYLVGDPTKGFYYMMEALNLSRVCNAIASIGIMQRAFLEAKKYAYKRNAFGKRLADFPMVKETLADMAVKQEVEASAIFSIIPLFERVMLKKEQMSTDDVAMNRLLIALLKMETAEQAIHFAHEAIEMHGGNGYIEDFVTPRLLRDAQVLTVWEGTANILGLEVLRLIHKYNVHHAFTKRMREEMKALPEQWRNQKAVIEQGIRQLEGAVAILARESNDIQTFHCKRVARLMTKIYESVIALKDAVIGGERKQIIADIYLRNAWEGKEVDLEMLQVRYFDVLMNEGVQVGT